MDFLCERKSRHRPISEKDHLNASDPHLMIH
jgi:hypothetical protein